MSGAEGKPVLLTEADIARFHMMCSDAVIAELRERGLIAPEPEPKPLVDVELDKALEKAEFLDERNRIPWANGFRDGFRRGMEIAPAARLTREQVREAMLTVWGDVTPWANAYADALHTALTKQMEGRDG